MTDAANIRTATSGDGVATILLDRAAVRNAISVAQMRDVADAVADATRARVRALVIGSTGPVFCAGADLGLIESALDGDTAAILGGLVDGVNEVVLALHASRCPTIAAVEGPAVGAGMALALATDLRIVARSTRLLPGFFGIAATPDSGASYALQRYVGQARALSFVLRNRAIDADTILAWGLAEEIVDDGATLDAAVTLAVSLGDVPAEALVGLRDLLDVAPTNSLVDQMRAEKASIESLWPTANFTEGIRAFLERRKPRFNSTG